MKLKINESATILIYSKKIWNETNITIEVGEEYKFEAFGTWRDMVLLSCDADGYNCLYMMLYKRWKRSKENNWFALIGSINQKDDFLIGKKWQKVFQQNGKLWCYANDLKCMYWNNSGHLSLKITRLN
jgi:hypothetical protein